MMVLQSNKELAKIIKRKANIYSLGIDVVKKFIKEHQVDCDWNESGKYFCFLKKLKIKKILSIIFQIHYLIRGDLNIVY